MGKGGGGARTAAEPERNEDGSLKNPTYDQKAAEVNITKKRYDDEGNVLSWSPYQKSEIDRRYEQELRIKKLEDSLLAEKDNGKEAITNDLGRLR